MDISRFIVVLVLIGVFAYTVSYAKWVWKEKNRVGAMAVFVVGAASLLLPLYMIFFREG